MYAKKKAAETKAGLFDLLMALLLLVTRPVAYPLSKVLFKLNQIWTHLDAVAVVAVLMGCIILVVTLNSLLGVIITLVISLTMAAVMYLHFQNLEAAR
jgi:hypothetical protein